MDFDPMLLPPAIRSGYFTQLELGKDVPLACPQEGYLRMQREQPGGLLCPMNGLAVSFGREVSDFVLRHHELFSSAVDMPLGNVRPLIPLNIDPPKHATYRKILDPLFAPKRMDAHRGRRHASAPTTSSTSSSIAASATSPRSSPSSSRRRCSSA